MTGALNVRRLHEELGREIGRLARGGAGFALPLPATDEAGARRVLEDLRTRLRTALAAHDPPVRFSARALVVIDPATNAESVLRRADDLMYEAKRQGKDTAMVAVMEPAGDGG